MEKIHRCINYAQTDEEKQFAKIMELSRILKYHIFK